MPRGEPITAKSSEKISPPEAFVADERDAVATRAASDDPLIAAPTFDVWSFGTVLYEAAVRSACFVGDTDDSLKQTQRNPWEVFAETHPSGSTIKGEIKNITEFGLFVGLDGDIDGMVHLSDISWEKSGEQAIEEFKKGDVVEAKVLDVDVEKERVSLGIKQLGGDPMESLGDNIRKGTVVTCTVTGVTENGIEVTVGEDNMPAFIRRAELARDRGDQRPERFAVGDKVDARVTQFDRTARKIQLSIKALEIAEEKEAVAQYGSSDSGASLGDILGAALNKANTEDK